MKRLRSPTLLDVGLLFRTLFHTLGEKGWKSAPEFEFFRHAYNAVILGNHEFVERRVFKRCLKKPRP